jgi:hypothetical protein
MKIALLALLLMFGFQSDDGRGSDGHFHDPNTGEVQPEHCNNGFENKHKCECQRASQNNCDKDDPDANIPGKMCKTYCRQNDCHCHNSCS